MTFEDDPKYMALVEKISAGLVEAGFRADLTAADRIAPMMLACDVAAQVILTGYPRDQWMAVLDIFLTRLGNTMDRRAAEGTQEGEETLQ